ncbi:hypothetical protein HanHA300_Chr12g0450141 [Helianthus annuus]|nr:hypothetical protein HanHA300_Chr12g0450141 [Helianthus annuus]KAJ0675567.1 hypothetical protein HanLR1_Chr12g0452631 [Helianthus annuus]KAJ0678843.1 hypothetical protein HanOQP8_Chr12g0452501 [Helianthus annuus]
MVREKKHTMAGEGKLQESQGNMSSHCKTFLFFIEFCSFEVSTTHGNMGVLSMCPNPDLITTVFFG